MSTIIVHGTFDPDGTWWRVQEPGRFLDAVARGMREGGKEPDLWMIGNRPVSDFPQLQPKERRSFWSGRKPAPFQQIGGHFRWSGADLHDAGRMTGGRELARYLDCLAQISPQEEIDLIAHSHGCNLVKIATNHIGPHVRLGRAVFLAAPHFERVEGGPDQYLYPLNAGRLAGGSRGAPPALNLYSDDDFVQMGLSETFADAGLPPGMPRVKMLGFEGTPIVNAHRVDPDPRARSAYDNLSMPTEMGQGIIAGITVHGAVHGPTVGRLVGYWLARWPELSGEACLQYVGVDALRDTDSG